MEKDKKEKNQRKFTGEVVSNKMVKTSVVRIDRTKVHPIYHKRYTVSKRYKIHDKKNECSVGDLVEFVECRPLSKDKRWRLVKIVKKANQ